MAIENSRKVFSHRIRKLNADEMEKVVGGQNGGLKTGGGMDFAGKDFN